MSEENDEEEWSEEDDGSRDGEMFRSVDLRKNLRQPRKNCSFGSRINGRIIATPIRN